MDDRFYLLQSNLIFIYDVIDIFIPFGFAAVGQGVCVLCLWSEL